MLARAGEGFAAMVLVVILTWATTLARSGMGFASSASEMKFVASWSVALALVSCVASCSAGPQVPPALSTGILAASKPTSVPPTPDVDVSVEVRAPLRARYDASLAGASKPSLGVVLTNRWSRPLDVSDLRVHLRASRQNVAFHCAAEVGPPPGAREPRELAPGKSFVFERTLDCALPLVGAYAVSVATSFGNGPFRTPRDVRLFTLTVAALPNVGPREIEGLPGLWASLGASNVTTANSSGTRTVVSLVNSTKRPIELPPMDLALRVYRVGNSVPCEDEPKRLRTPDVLGPGQTHLEPLEISCLGLAMPGAYEIAGRLLVPRQGKAEGSQEIALGRLSIVVVNDLLLGPTWR